MASDAVFVDYVRDQLGASGAISFRRMFGEYAMYCEGKVVGLVCDNQLFVKPTPAGRELLGAGVVEGQPYPGAKPWLLMGESLDDRTTLCRLIRITADALPMPAPKKPKAAKAPAKRATAKRAATRVKD
ncbi:MAG: TfoX/Sxy family protein [Burkholderiales bacterium]|nr:TfoX/Sxy family protein [Burkholderiales bacterium]